MQAAEPLPQVQAPAPAEAEDLLQPVNLDMIAAWVHLSKSAMRRYVKRMPPPFRPGRGRRESLWNWPDVRPWLVFEFGMPKLPKVLPAFAGRASQEEE